MATVNSRSESTGGSSLGPRKTMIIMVTIIGCVAILWPKVFYPMMVGPGQTKNVIKDHRGPGIRQERPPHLRPETIHPAMRERGRGIPPSGTERPQSAPRIVEGRPGPIPGMRPPMGAGSHQSAKSANSMGFIMPLYTIGIVSFFIYTILKLIFKKTPNAPYPEIKPDPAFRNEVFTPDHQYIKRPDSGNTKLGQPITSTENGVPASAVPVSNGNASSNFSHSVQAEISVDYEQLAAKHDHPATTDSRIAVEEPTVSVSVAPLEQASTASSAPEETNNERVVTNDDFVQPSHDPATEKVVDGIVVKKVVRFDDEGTSSEIVEEVASQVVDEVIQEAANQANEAAEAAAIELVEKVVEQAEAAVYETTPVDYPEQTETTEVVEESISVEKVEQLAAVSSEVKTPETNEEVISDIVEDSAQKSVDQIQVSEDAIVSRIANLEVEAIAAAEEEEVQAVTATLSEQSNLSEETPHETSRVNETEISPFDSNNVLEESVKHVTEEIVVCKPEPEPATPLEDVSQTDAEESAIKALAAQMEAAVAHQAEEAEIRAIAEDLVTKVLEQAEEIANEEADGNSFVLPSYDPATQKLVDGQVINRFEPEEVVQDSGASTSVEGPVIEEIVETITVKDVSTVCATQQSEEFAIQDAPVVQTVETIGTLVEEKFEAQEKLPIQTDFEETSESQSKITEVPEMAAKCIFELTAAEVAFEAQKEMIMSYSNAELPVYNPTTQKLVDGIVIDRFDHSDSVAEEGTSKFFPDPVDAEENQIASEEQPEERSTSEPAVVETPQEVVQEMSSQTLTVPENSTSIPCQETSTETVEQTTEEALTPAEEHKVSETLVDAEYVEATVEKPVEETETSSVVDVLVQEQTVETKLEDVCESKPEQESCEEVQSSVETLAELSVSDEITQTTSDVTQESSQEVSEETLLVEARESVLESVMEQSFEGSTDDASALLVEFNDDVSPVEVSEIISESKTEKLVPQESTDKPVEELCVEKSDTAHESFQGKLVEVTSPEVCAAVQEPVVEQVVTETTSQDVVTEQHSTVETTQELSLYVSEELEESTVVEVPKFAEVQQCSSVTKSTETAQEPSQEVREASTSAPEVESVQEQFEEELVSTEALDVDVAVEIQDQPTETTTVEVPSVVEESKVDKQQPVTDSTQEKPMEVVEVCDAVQELVSTETSIVDSSPQESSTASVETQEDALELAMVEDATLVEETVFEPTTTDESIETQLEETLVAMPEVSEAVEVMKQATALETLCVTSKEELAAESVSTAVEVDQQMTVPETPKEETDDVTEVDATLEEEEQVTVSKAPFVTLEAESVVESADVTEVSGAVETQQVTMVLETPFLNLTEESSVASADVDEVNEEVQVEQPPTVLETLSAVPKEEFTDLAEVGKDVVVEKQVTVPETPFVDPEDEYLVASVDVSQVSKIVEVQEQARVLETTFVTPKEESSVASTEVLEDSEVVPAEQAVVVSESLSAALKEESPDVAEVGAVVEIEQQVNAPETSIASANVTEIGEVVEVEQKAIVLETSLAAPKEESSVDVTEVNEAVPVEQQSMVSETPGSVPKEESVVESFVSVQVETPFVASGSVTEESVPEVESVVIREISQTIESVETVSFDEPVSVASDYIEPEIVEKVSTTEDQDELTTEVNPAADKEAEVSKSVDSAVVDEMQSLEETSFEASNVVDVVDETPRDPIVEQTVTENDVVLEQSAESADEAGTVSETIITTEDINDCCSNEPVILNGDEAALEVATISDVSSDNHEDSASKRFTETSSNGPTIEEVNDESVKSVEEGNASEEYVIKVDFEKVDTSEMISEVTEEPIVTSPDVSRAASIAPTAPVTVLPVLDIISENHEEVLSTEIEMSATEPKGSEQVGTLNDHYTAKKLEHAAKEALVERTLTEATAVASEIELIVDHIITEKIMHTTPPEVSSQESSPADLDQSASESVSEPIRLAASAAKVVESIVIEDTVSATSSATSTVPASSFHSAEANNSLNQLSTSSDTNLPVTPSVQSQLAPSSPSSPAIELNSSSSKQEDDEQIRVAPNSSVNLILVEKNQVVAHTITSPGSVQHEHSATSSSSSTYTTSLEHPRSSSSAGAIDQVPTSVSNVTNPKFLTLNLVNYSPSDSSGNNSNSSASALNLSRNAAGTADVAAVASDSSDQLMELDLLRRKLDETELAMAKIIANMGAIPKGQETEDTDNTETAEKLPESNGHVVKPIVVDSSRSSNDRDATEAQQQQLPELDGEDVVPTIERQRETGTVPKKREASVDRGHLKVIPMEKTATYDSGRQSPRPATPVQSLTLDSSIVDADAAESKCVLLDTKVPQMSKVRIADSDLAVQTLDACHKSDGETPFDLNLIVVFESLSNLNQGRSLELNVLLGSEPTTVERSSAVTRVASPTREVVLSGKMKLSLVKLDDNDKKSSDDLVTKAKDGSDKKGFGPNEE